MEKRTAYLVTSGPYGDSVLSIADMQSLTPEHPSEGELLQTFLSRAVRDDRGIVGVDADAADAVEVINMINSLAKREQRFPPPIYVLNSRGMHYTAENVHMVTPEALKTLHQETRYRDAEPRILMLSDPERKGLTDVLLEETADQFQKAGYAVDRYSTADAALDQRLDEHRYFAAIVSADDQGGIGGTLRWYGVDAYFLPTTVSPEDRFAAGLFEHQLLGLNSDPEVIVHMILGDAQAEDRDRRILIYDADTKSLGDAFEELTNAGYRNILGTHEFQRARQVLRLQNFDLVLADATADGQEVLRQAQMARPHASRAYRTGSNETGLLRDFERGFVHHIMTKREDLEKRVERLIVRERKARNFPKIDDEYPTIILAIYGPKGSGKTLIANSFLSHYNAWHLLMPRTTARPKRQEERAGRPSGFYHVSPEAFDTKRDAFMFTYAEEGYEYGVETVPKKGAVSMITTRSKDAIRKLQLRFPNVQVFDIQRSLANEDRARELLERREREPQEPPEAQERHPLYTPILYSFPEQTAKAADEVLDAHRRLLLAIEHARR